MTSNGTHHNSEAYICMPTFYTKLKDKLKCCYDPDVSIGLSQPHRTGGTVVDD